LYADIVDTIEVVGRSQSDVARELIKLLSRILVRTFITTIKMPGHVVALQYSPSGDFGKQACSRRR
jgi:hypothetical protein